MYNVYFAGPLFTHDQLLGNVALATAIKNCLNPESNRNYSNNIYKSKRKYSWSKFVKKLLGLKNW